MDYIEGASHLGIGSYSGAISFTKLAKPGFWSDTIGTQEMMNLLISIKVNLPFDLYSGGIFSRLDLPIEAKQ
jgi:hypothetical protein